MDGSKGKVLIVDDEEMMRTLIKMKLTKEGYHCEEAGDAEKAWAKLQANPSEFVFLDINMPGKPGNVLLPEITRSFPDTSVIMASGVDDPTIIAQCIKDGAEDYIYKPFKIFEILLSLRRALDKKELELNIRRWHQNNLKKQDAELRNLFWGAIEALISALETNDKYTAGHSQRVTKLAVGVGKELKISARELDNLRWGALLHDVGKIAIDPDILNKQGKLSEDEYRYIMTHAIVGPSLVKPFVNDEVVDIISNHHAHYDGSGLNQVLVGEDIPQGARILTAVDAFDAMTSDRPYRSAIPQDKALEELKNCSGTQFDPLVADALIGMVGRGAFEEAVPRGEQRSVEFDAAASV